MKLTGVEGMSPEDIRQEIERGGKLVIYTYCVSIVVMTFKRPTDIRLVRAGHNPVMGGLPFTLISLVFGWWGFPWGPIYTIETIYRNLSGGIDVTADVLRSILPQPPVMPATAAAGATSPTPPAYTPPARKPGINFKTIGFMAGAAAFLVALGLTLYCYQQQQHLKVALISGLNEPYTVTLNGESHRLAPRGHKVVELPEGEFVLADAPGGHVVGKPQTFHFALPFFDHLGTDKVAVINPDATAIIYRQDVVYYKDGTAPASAPEPAFTLYANRQSYFLDQPDYVLEDAPEKVSMPSGTSVMTKYKLDYVRREDLGGILTTLQERSGYPAVVEHFQLLSRQRSDEAMVQAATLHLKKEDWAAFFRPRLMERPVLLEWHRHYQRAMEYAQPEFDLAGEYRGYLKSEPNNGALLYLTGRVLDDRAESHQLWKQALAAEPPCGYASAAFGFDALSDGNFEQAAAHYEACAKAGVTSAALEHYRRETYWATRQFDKVLESVRAARQKAPLGLELTGLEISALLEANPDPTAAANVKTAYLASARAAHFADADLKAAQAYLDTIYCYQTKQLPQYLEAAKQLDAPAYRFDAAITQGDVKAAEKACGELDQPRSTNFLLLYLAAKLAKDDAGAEKFFAAAIEAMRHETHEGRQAARLLATSPLPATDLCQLGLDAEEKSVLLTALGVRDTANRATYHALAAKLNFNPTFPHQFLASIHQL